MTAAPELAVVESHAIPIAEPVAYAAEVASDQAMFAAPVMDSPPSPDAMKITPPRVLRALRRRWWLALPVALACAAIAGFAAQKFVTSAYTVRTQIFIPANRPAVPFAGNESSGDPASNQRRHSAFIRSRSVLQSAMQRPGIGELSIIRDNADPAGMLDKELVVDFGSSPDIMRVSLKGPSPDELIPLLNAIRESFLDEGVNREITDKTVSLKWHRDFMAEEQNKLAASDAEINKKLEKLNAPDVATVKATYQANITELSNLRTQRFTLDVQRRGLAKTRDDLIAAPPDEKNFGVNPKELKDAIERAEASDAQLATLRTTIAKLDSDIAGYERVLPEGATHKNLEDKKKEKKAAEQALKDRLAKIEREQREKLEEDVKRGAEFRQREYRTRVADLKSQVDSLTAQLESTDREIQRLERVNIEQAKGIAEIDQIGARASIVENRIKASKQRADTLESELAIASPFKAQTHEEAIVTQVPNPNKKHMMVAGIVVVGFLGGLLGVAFLDLRSHRIDAPQGVERLLHTGVVGCIPRVSPRTITSLTQPHGGLPTSDEIELCDATDACRALLLNALSGSQSNVIMVASALPGEGKTSLAAQLALSLARAGCRTLLIDADIRQPSVHTLFGRSISPGLTDVLRKTYPLLRVGRRSPMPNLVIVPAGQCHPHEAVSLLQLRLPRVLAKCKSYFDVILIDTPPVLNFPDAMIIGRHTDGTILSLMNEVSTLPAAQSACARLRSLNIPLLGAVLNGARVCMNRGYY